MPSERTDEDIARGIVEGWRVVDGSLELRARIVSSLRAARAQGVAEGMEEAAKVADAFKGSDVLRSTAPDLATQLNRVSLIRREARYLASAIRSLAANRRGKGE